MSDDIWKLKEGAELNIDDAAKIACALKSSAVKISSLDTIY